VYVPETRDQELLGAVNHLRPGGNAHSHAWSHRLDAGACDQNGMVRKYIANVPIHHVDIDDGEVSFNRWLTNA
jgi:hypothetical protein